MKIQESRGSYGVFALRISRLRICGLAWFGPGGGPWGIEVLISSHSAHRCINWPTPSQLRIAILPSITHHELPVQWTRKGGLSRDNSTPPFRHGVHPSRSDNLSIYDPLAARWIVWPPQMTNPNIKWMQMISGETDLSYHLIQPTYSHKNYTYWVLIIIIIIILDYVAKSSIQWRPHQL